MIDDLLARAHNWLTAKGEYRKKAIDEASGLLLEKYAKRWISLIPIELHRLAYSLRAKIVPLNNMTGDACLMPTKNGFKILMNAKLHIGRYRTSIAHELVHTLFYTNPEKNMPRRIIPHSKSEEDFCFDVARRILAPEQHLKDIGIFNDYNPEVIFSKLTDILLISRSLAARIMLADLCLIKGIAGRWEKTSAGWKLVRQSATATPSLTRQERKILRDLAKISVESPNIDEPNPKVICYPEISTGGSFIIAWKE